MENLSHFLTVHVKKHLFNGGLFMAGEKFDAALERILHEGIFNYRKRQVRFSSSEDQPKVIRQDAVLMEIEANNPYDQQRKG